MFVLFGDDDDDMQTQTKEKKKTRTFLITKYELNMAGEDQIGENLLVS